MQIQNFLKNKKKNSAFVMLFAVVVSGIILTIALGVTNIALRELSFDTGAKSTNDAFFAADAGVECALFYELAGEGETSAFGQPSAGLNTNCAGTDVDLNNGSSTPTTGPWTFYLYPLGSGGNACAIVNVTKTLNPNVTTIVAKGYNLGGNTYNCSSTNPNRVERELVVVIGDPTLPSVPDNFDLNVALQGLGTVDSDAGHPGINCNPACFASYLDGTVLTLTATPSSGYTFSNWSGDCASEPTNQCNLTIDQDKNVTAIFTAVTHDVTVTLPNNGNITSSPGDIDCGSTANPDTCVDSFAENSPVVLTADPDPGYQFDGWTGPDCSGVGTCNLIMNGDKTVGATFSLMSTYPQVASSAFSEENADVEVHTVDLPTGIQVGDLLLAFFSVDGNNTPVTWPTNGGTWTVISQIPSSPGSTTNTLSIAYKIATAVEAGSPNITVATTGFDNVSTHQVFRIAKDTFYSAGSYIQASTRSNGNSTAPNSNSLTASWGSTRNLWFTVTSRNNATFGTPSYPVNYTNGFTNAGGVSTDGQSLGIARRERITATEDPGTFTYPSDAWLAYTLVIRGI